MLGVLVALLFTVQRIVLVNVWIESTVPVSVRDRDASCVRVQFSSNILLMTALRTLLHQDPTRCLTAKSLDYSRNNGTT
jgi:hypothetical protein